MPVSFFGDKDIASLQIPTGWPADMAAAAFEDDGQFTKVIGMLGKCFVWSAIGRPYRDWKSAIGKDPVAGIINLCGMFVLC